MKDAFKTNDGQKVPLVWNHQHNEAYNVLGHALLRIGPEGVYAYGFFNGKPNKAKMQNFWSLMGTYLAYPYMLIS